MKRLNRNGRSQPKTVAPKYLSFDELQSALGRKATVVDCRPTQKFAAGHVPGYEEGYRADPYAAGGYGPYPPQG